MRGSTSKLIRKFAQHLIDNTPEAERGNKTYDQMVDEIKVHWRTKGKIGQKFIHKVLNGELQ